MKRYLYLSVTPEALIASMLPPEEFGNYLAVGTKKRTRGQAIFWEVDMNAMQNQLPMDYIESRCVTQPDGQPKHSVYIEIYRVLEMVPLHALRNLYLTTDDGRVLALNQAPYPKEEPQSLHLYQELCPVTPRVASTLAPREFMNYMTSEVPQIRLPKLAFVELGLEELATNPVGGDIQDLPYPNIDHLRDCLVGLRREPEKIKKTVIRFYQGDLLFRTCKNGFFIGSKDDFMYYPLPGVDELEDKHYAWWRSAKSPGFK